MKKIIIKPFIFVLLCINNCTLNAQVDLTNTGILYSSGSGDILFINGNFTNTSTAALTNNGSLYVKGNLINNQSGMSSGIGTLYLNGTFAQLVSGTQVYKTYNFNSDNTAGITLNNNLSVSGLHTFTNGLIGSSATPNYLVYEAGSSYTGATDIRHATGWVKKMGSTGFTFPVGDASYLRTAGVLNLSAASEINCHYYTPTANIYNLTAPLVQVNPREYWQIDKISGGTAEIALNWDNSKVVFDNVLLTEISVAHYTGGNWTDAGGSAVGNTLTTGSISSGAVGTFSPFTFGYRSFPVPLKLISFTGERRTGTSYLHWVTDNEQGVAGFEIQRSYDGINFVTIGQLGARNTSFQENYSYEDRTALQGLAYYRIKSVDMDGKFSYTKIVALTESQFSNNSFLVLNPVRSVITVFNKSGYDGQFDYRLFNAGGQLILKGHVNMGVNGSGVLPLPSQSAGIYVLELSNSRTQFRQKILVEK